MFLGDPAQWLPSPREPRRRGGERMLGWLIGLNLALVVLAPIGGATFLQPLVAWLRG